MNKREKEREVKRRGETTREERRCEFEARVRLIEIRMNSRRGGRKVGG